MGDELLMIDEEVMEFKKKCEDYFGCPFKVFGEYSYLDEPTPPKAHICLIPDLLPINRGIL